MNWNQFLVVVVVSAAFNLLFAFLLGEMLIKSITKVYKNSLEQLAKDIKEIFRK